MGYGQATALTAVLLAHISGVWAGHNFYYDSDDNRYDTPLEPPAPGLPPAPPQAPGYRIMAYSCTDSCIDSIDQFPLGHDGTCDDATRKDQPLGWVPLCSIGTDCKDCGVQYLCTSCPQECNDLGARSAKTEWCLESMYTDSICDAACNNWQCGFDSNGCSEDEAIAKCRPLQQASRNALSPAPNKKSKTKTPVEFDIVKSEPLAVDLNTGNGQWNLQLTMHVAMRWRDVRLKTMACKGLMQDLLSFDETVTANSRVRAEEDRQMLWLPAFGINGTGLTYRADTSGKSFKNQIQVANFDFIDGSDGAWMGGTPEDDSTECVDCAKLNFSFTFKYEFNPGLKFETYPFDQQAFRITFDFGAEVEVFSCEHVMNATNSTYLGKLKTEGKLVELLPTSGEYNLIDDTVGVTMEHPIVNGRKDTSRCELVFRVGRDSSIVFLKVIIPTIIIVYLGLMSAFLRASQHSGDRAALLGVSILITMVNLERDTGLGKLRYSTWFDTFNLVQMSVLIIALIEGMVEHQLWEKDKEAASLTLNFVWQVMMMIGVYPTITVALIIDGYGYRLFAALLYGAVCPLMVLAAACSFRIIIEAGRRKRTKLANELSQADKTDAKFSELLSDAFEAFDLDGSGELDLKEIRVLLKAMYGRERELFRIAIELAREQAVATEGQITMGQLEDILDDDRLRTERMRASPSKEPNLLGLNRVVRNASIRSPMKGLADGLFRRKSTSRRAVAPEALAVPAEAAPAPASCTVVSTM